MNTLLTLTSLCLFAAVPPRASEAAAVPFCGTLPPSKQEPPAPTLSGLGRLEPAAPRAMPRWDTSSLPRWQVRLGGKAYLLVFDGKKDLEAAAARLSGRWVRIQGRVKQRTFMLSE